MNKGQNRRSFIQQATLLTTAFPLAKFNNLGTRVNAFDNSENADEYDITSQLAGDYKIEANNNGYQITAGNLVRNLVCTDNQIKTADITVGGSNMLSEISTDFQVTLYQAEPNRLPKGIQPGEYEPIKWPGTDPSSQAVIKTATEWSNPIKVNGGALSENFKILYSSITNPGPGITRLTLRATSTETNPLEGVAIDVFYEVYAKHPTIRKWIEINNNSHNWLKIDNLIIDDLNFSSAFLTNTLLTPEERGAGCSIIAFSNKQLSKGIIAVSEIPSATRLIQKNGAMGYNNDNFEWVLGPGENFISEPVFIYAFEGNVYKTISGISTPLDRTVERPFKEFLEEYIGLRAKTQNLPVPLWCSWTHFLGNVNDQNMREQADIAARAGFHGFQIDAGWGEGAEPYSKKFPDFTATSRYIIAKGLKFGVWISDYRNKSAEDFKAVPDGSSLPGIKRGNSYGMSFASSWRNYFANDLVSLHDKYKITYVKQDLTVIKFGDIAAAHESRTLKESYLRGIRGLFAANDTVARRAPDMVTEITHEMYWGTPGVPCDIAVLKHACTYHMPPNEYYGAGKTNERPNASWSFEPLKLRSDLITGCKHARERFFAHRGLPLYCLEFYSASTVNIRNSLTTSVQDRQLCSWLMGALSVFAGDLATLTTENVAHYRKRFELIKQLQRQYNIYQYFQYSGVPQPTDTDWHWWGKLNARGYGAVVVIRGSQGKDARIINIPWVTAKRKYLLTAHFAGKKLGVFTGNQLIKGSLSLKLPAFGQEIIEISQLT